MSPHHISIVARRSVHARYTFHGLADLQYNSLTAPLPGAWAQAAADRAAAAAAAPPPAKRKNAREKGKAKETPPPKLDAFMYAQQPLLIVPQQFSSDDPFEGYNFK